MNLNESLFNKYNIRVPRYTSYPTVPNWQSPAPTQEEWLSHIRSKVDHNDAISMYIHIPFCEKVCSYCACNKKATKNHRHEGSYVEAILDEWQLYLQALNKTPTLQSLHFGGGTPSFLSPANLARLLDGIYKSVYIPKQRNYSFEVHPHYTTYAHLETLARYGFNRLSIGVQDVNETILKRIKREQTKEEVEQVSKWARYLGIESINYDIIYGLPGQQESHILETMDFIKAQRPERLAFYGYAHVPNISKAQAKFKDAELKVGFAKHKLREVGEAELVGLGYEKIGFDHFALPHDPLTKAKKAKSLHRNFMGYTTDRNTLIALGCSSISDTGDFFIQNSKKVEKYKGYVTEGVLPIVRGHVLTKLEKRIRHHVLQIICNQFTLFTYNKQDQLILNAARVSLQDKQQDGLISLQKNTLEVLDTGIYFLRNICADIDLFYGIDNKKRYSTAV